MLLNVFKALLFSFCLCYVETLNNKVPGLESVRSYEDLLQLAKSSEKKPTKSYASYQQFLENHFQDLIKKVIDITKAPTTKYSNSSNTQNGFSNKTNDESALSNENKKYHRKKNKKEKPYHTKDLSTRPKNNGFNKTKKQYSDKKDHKKSKINPNDKLEKRRKLKWLDRKKTEPLQNKTLVKEIKHKQQNTKVTLTTPQNTIFNTTSTNTSDESNDLRLAIMKFSQIKYKGPLSFQNESKPTTSEQKVETRDNTPTFLMVAVFIMVFSPSSILLICFKCYSRKKPTASKKQLLLRQLNAPSHSFFDTYLKHMEGSRSNRVISFGNLPSYREYKIKRALRGGQSETESDVSGREAEHVLLEHSMHEESNKLTPDRGILKGTKRTRGKDGGGLVSFCEEDIQDEEKEKMVHLDEQRSDMKEKCTDEKNENEEIVEKKEIFEILASLTLKKDDKTTTPIIHLPTFAANRNAKVQVVLPQQLSNEQYQANEAINAVNK